jgi:hypothetical protein
MKWVQSHARQATLARVSFCRAKLMASDDLGNFLTHVTTFHGLRMTLTTNGDEILMTLKTNGENTLTTPTTGDEDTVMTPFMTHNSLMTTPHDISESPCDEIVYLYDIHCPHD